MGDPVFCFWTRDESRRSDEEVERYGMEGLGSWIVGVRERTRRGGRGRTQDVGERLPQLDEFGSGPFQLSFPG